MLRLHRTADEALRLHLHLTFGYVLSTTAQLDTNLVPMAKGMYVQNQQLLWFVDDMHHDTCAMQKGPTKYIHVLDA
jgi:hypothetical protein